jgi:formate hydrogenlyase subunit 3/multisubunit Na+/H+ antiporter MnhD subunit
MLDAGAVAEASSAGNSLLVLTIALPVAGVLIAFVVGGRGPERIALAFIPIGLGLSFAIFADVRGDAKALTYVLGEWRPPLGVSLRADGVSAVMLVATALIMSLTALFARAGFSTPNGEIEARRPFVFWTLLLAVWAALNSVFLASDLFNIYVALELLTFAAVPLVCLDGRAETLAAAGAPACAGGNQRCNGKSAVFAKRPAVISAMASHVAGSERTCSAKSPMSKVP